MPSTIKLHRVLRAGPERVYRAFIDPDAKAKWLPPNGFTGKVHEDDPRVGGSYRMSFTNFTTGTSHSFGGEYLELVPGERIRYADRFDDPGLPGDMNVTVILKQVSVGTELNITQETSRMQYRRKPATSAGRNRSPSSQSWSRQRSRTPERRRRRLRIRGCATALAIAAVTCALIWLAFPVLRHPVFIARLLTSPPPSAVQVPVMNVTKKQIANSWGSARSGGRSHQGVDIFAQRGTPVLSATDGIVFRVGTNALGGQVMNVLGPGRQVHYYAHLDRYGSFEPGDIVYAGSILGYVGNTGNARDTPSHLHYGVYDPVRGAINPWPLLK